TWPGVLLASVVVLGGHLATFVVAARAAGATAPLTRLVPLALLALLAMTVPLSVGGWGPREGVTAWAFGAVGLSAAQGLTVAIVYGLFALVAALPGLLVLVARWAERFRAAPVPATARPVPVPV
ncbi:MAG TPA: lysylphosphatidylglycerol synthase domain-containing protein, partial [Micromonosporaceae bacterium]|nr:lysylphosphatidylglycerol synthase domain-containing protein [Micromonosporaceae bacterium]